MMKAVVVALLACVLVISRADDYGPGPSASPTSVHPIWNVALNALVANMESRWSQLDAACSTDAPFALTYLYMTKEVRDRVAAQYFDFGNEMANFTLAFANRYLTAFDAWNNGQQSTVTAPWEEAFSWGDSGQSSVTSDLFLGINAHINYDLSLTVERQRSAVAGPRNYKNDYDRINDCIADVLQPSSTDLGNRYDPTLSPGASNALTDPSVINMIISWRENAWQNGAQLTSSQGTPQHAVVLQNIETQAVTAAQAFQTPSSWSAADRLAYCEAHHT